MFLESSSKDAAFRLHASSVIKQYAPERSRTGVNKTMGIKRTAASVVLFLMMFSAAQSQEINTASTGDITENRNGEAGLLLLTESDTGMEISDGEQEKRMNEVWKRKRAKYKNVFYGMQTLKSSHADDMKSDMAVGLTLGRTFYLHRKPIAGIMKFGLDWSYLDVNFATYPDLTTPGSGTSGTDDAELPDWGIMQLEAGMSIGPSLTINPVDHLKLGLYFRVTPSYSLMMQNDRLSHHYATFFNAGFTVDYKVISLGIETRRCGETVYDGIALNRLDNVYDDEGDFHDPFESYTMKMRTNTLRIFIGFRF